MIFRDITAFAWLKTFPDLTRAIGLQGVFFIHGAVALIGCAVVFFFLPETRGKSLAEIETLFKSRPLPTGYAKADVEDRELYDKRDEEI